MLVSEFDYELLEKLIAQYPSEKRENSRMMVLDKNAHTIEHKHFYDIVDYINEDCVLILNDTKVIPARLFGTKEETGAHIEVFLLKEKENHDWEVLIKPSKRVKSGTVIKISSEYCSLSLKKYSIRKLHIPDDITRFVVNNIFTCFESCHELVRLFL